MKLAVIFWLYLSFISSGHAAVINFDDLTSPDGSIENTYAGLNWDGIGYESVSHLFHPTGSGFINGLVSGDNVAFNLSGGQSSISGARFNFNGAYFTAAWKEGLTVQALGYSNGSLLFDKSISLKTDAPHFFAFNYSNIDKLVFNSFGGVTNPRYLPILSGGDPVQFVMDDLDISTVVPIPAAFWLFGSGCVGLIGIVRRKYSATAF